jgi:hypothetical protein
MRAAGSVDEEARTATAELRGRRRRHDQVDLAVRMAMVRTGETVHLHDVDASKKCKIVHASTLVKPNHA